MKLSRVAFFVPQLSNFLVRITQGSSGAVFALGPHGGITVLVIWCVSECLATNPSNAVALGAGGHPAQAKSLPKQSLKALATQTRCYNCKSEYKIH
eukprot:2868832-Amphidinium_carterae.1